MDGQDPEDEVLEPPHGYLRVLPTAHAPPRPPSPWLEGPRLFFTPALLTPETLANAEAILLTPQLFRRYVWPADLFKVVNVWQEPFESPEVMTAIIDPAGANDDRPDISGLARFLMQPTFIEYCQSQNIRRLACDARDLKIVPLKDRELPLWSELNPALRLTVYGCPKSTRKQPRTSL